MRTTAGPLPPVSKCQSRTPGRSAWASRADRIETPAIGPRDDEEGTAGDVSLRIIVRGRSRHHCVEGLPFLDDIRRELRCAAGTDVPRRVDRSGRDEQDVADFEGYRWVHHGFPHGSCTTHADPGIFPE